jgi:hypothetical protein
MSDKVYLLRSTLLEIIKIDIKINGVDQ